MRSKGIAYDTGFVRNGIYSRQRCTPDTVRRELEIIRDDLRCNAVQITGGDADRIELAGRIAAELGLEVWFSPYPLELTTDEITDFLVDTAARAERIRTSGAEVVFVAGVELSLMNRGFVDGGDVEERLGRVLADPGSRGERIAEVSERLDAFFGELVPAVRQRFGGRITYAAIPFERIDWSPFDVVTVELIRSAEVADQFRDGVRALVAGAKPVAITGFGTATWRGAGEIAPRSMEIVEHDPHSGVPVRLDDAYQRDEEGQARYLTELLEIFEAEGVDSAFVFLFALENLPHRPGGDPRDDLDLASLGIVRVLDGSVGTTYPGISWEPKAAFTAVAESYAG